MADNTIYLGQAGDRHVISEKLAAAAISPGHLVIDNGSGKFVKHASAGAGGLVMVAIEKPHCLVSEDYAADELCYGVQPKANDVASMRVKTGMALVKDVTPLASNGDGQLKIGTPGTDIIVAYAAQTITTSANQTLVRVQFASATSAI